MKRHDFDALSLVFGLLFVAGACWWAIYQALGSSRVPVTLAVAVTLVVVGVAGLLTAIPRGRTRTPAASDAPPVDLVKHDEP